MLSTHLKSNPLPPGSGVRQVCYTRHNLTFRLYTILYKKTRLSVNRNLELMAGIGEKIVIFCLRHLDRRGARGYNERRQVNQQTVAIAFIGNAVRIRSSPLYCKDDKRPDMSLSGTPDGKAGVRMSPSQETSRLRCVHVLSVGKAVQRRSAGLSSDCGSSLENRGEFFCAWIHASVNLRGA